MKILALDTIYSEELLNLSRFIKPTEAEEFSTITCKLSNMRIQDLEDPNIKIRIRQGILKLVPRRRHKKKRIQKKWIKRYGYTQVNDWITFYYKVLEINMSWKDDKVEFYCQRIYE